MNWSLCDWLANHSTRLAVWMWTDGINADEDRCYSDHAWGVGRVWDSRRSRAFRRQHAAWSHHHVNTALVSSTAQHSVTPALTLRFTVCLQL